MIVMRNKYNKRFKIVMAEDGEEMMVTMGERKWANSDAGKVVLR